MKEISGSPFPLFKGLISMINLEDRHRLHKFLMLELAIRYLKIDLETIRTMKCANALVPFTEKLLQQLGKQYHSEQHYFGTKKIRLIKWERLDHYFSRVSVTTAGGDATFKYANQAVKTHVEEILKEQIER